MQISLSHLMRKDDPSPQISLLFGWIIAGRGTEALSKHSYTHPGLIALIMSEFGLKGTCVGFVCWEKERNHITQSCGEVLSEVKL